MKALAKKKKKDLKAINSALDRLLHNKKTSTVLLTEKKADVSSSVSASASEMPNACRKRRRAINCQKSKLNKIRPVLRKEYDIIFKQKNDFQSSLGD